MKYVCTVCGYIYDEEKENVKFSDLEDTWTCQLCGASKSDFVPLEAPLAKEQEEVEIKIEDEEDLEKLTIGQLSALCSNLARGCEKQYRKEEEESFRKLANFFASVTPEENDATVENLANILKEDINLNFKETNKVITENKDRGAMRATVWSEKVTRMLASLLIRYERDGEKLLEENDIYICTVCGFVYIGKDAPEKCPVCKVQKNKFLKVDGRVEI